MSTLTCKLITRWSNKRKAAVLGPNSARPPTLWGLDPELFELVARHDMDVRYNLMCTCRYLYRKLRPNYRCPPPLSHNPFRLIHYKRCRRYLCWCCLKLAGGYRAVWWYQMQGVLLCMGCHNDLLLSTMSGFGQLNKLPLYDASKKPFDCSISSTIYPQSLIKQAILS